MCSPHNEKQCCGRCAAKTTQPEFLTQSLTVRDKDLLDQVADDADRCVGFPVILKHPAGWTIRLPVASSSEWDDMLSAIKFEGASAAFVEAIEMARRMRLGAITFDALTDFAWEEDVETGFIDGPLHPDLFDSETPTRIGMNRVAQAFDITVSFFRTDSCRLRVVACSQEEAEEVALVRAKDEEDGENFEVVNCTPSQVTEQDKIAYQKRCKSAASMTH